MYDPPEVKFYKHCVHDLCGDLCKHVITFPYVPTAPVVERTSSVEGTEATRSDSVRFSFLAIGTNPGPCIHGACAHEAGRVSKCVGLTGSLEEGCHETSGVFF